MAEPDSSHTDTVNNLFKALRKEYPSGQYYMESSWNAAQFVAGLVSLYQPKTVIEVGCLTGVTSAYILQAMTEYVKGHSLFVGYEILKFESELARMKLEKIVPTETWTNALKVRKETLVYPSNSELWPIPCVEWRIETGDFFQKYKEQDSLFSPVDFAFIDIDPKSIYLQAFDIIDWSENAVVVGHDRYMPLPLYQNLVDCVKELEDRLKMEGWSVFTLTPERGFLVGVKGHLPPRSI